MVLCAGVGSVASSEAQCGLCLSLGSRGWQSLAPSDIAPTSVLISAWHSSVSKFPFLMRTLVRQDLGLS